MQESTTMSGTEPNFEVMIRDCFESPEDVDTLTRFDDAFRPYLLTVLRRYCPDASLAADVYQATFIKFMNLFKSGLRPRTNSKAYLVAIAKHSLIDEIRLQRWSVPISEVCEGEITQTSPNEMQRTEVRLLVHQTMKQLDRRSQFILESYYLVGMPAADLAQRLGIQPASIHMAIKRCRMRLGKLLSNDVRNCRA
jgi:RNA polymerase sigma factor (sigma-70 family)